MSNVSPTSNCRFIAILQALTTDLDGEEVGATPPAPRLSPLGKCIVVYAQHTPQRTANLHC